MPKIEQNASIVIVENKKVTCESCLLSEPLGSLSGPMPSCGIVVCKLDDKQKQIDHFCPHGFWLFEGQVVDFKIAFQSVYDTKNHPKDLSRKGE